MATPNTSSGIGYIVGMDIERQKNKSATAFVVSVVWFALLVAVLLTSVDILLN